MKVFACDDWSDAFDLCREFDHPIVVVVDGDLKKIFPSGAAKEVKTRTYE